MVRDLVTFLLDLLTKPVLPVQSQIAYSATAQAGQVIMPRDISIIAPEPAIAKNPNEPLVFQDLEVAIDGAQTDVGYLLAHLVIDPGRVWVRNGALQHIQDRLALPGNTQTIGVKGLFQFWVTWLHRACPINISIYY